MIPRYSRPEMAAIWTDEAKLQRWLDVELAVCRAWARRGVIPPEDLAEIEAKAAFTVERTLEIEKTTNHDVVAFLTNVNENIGPASRRPNVVGSACTPWVRPTHTVSRCSSARAFSAWVSAACPSTMIRPLCTMASARPVSSTSLLVIP